LERIQLVVPGSAFSIWIGLSEGPGAFEVLRQNNATHEPRKIVRTVDVQVALIAKP
jgi:hypothetical protein